MTDRFRISTQIPPEMRSDLDRLKTSLGMKESDVIREMLRAGIVATDKAERRKLTSRIVDDPFGTGDNGA